MLPLLLPPPLLLLAMLLLLLLRLPVWIPWGQELPWCLPRAVP